MEEKAKRIWFDDRYIHLEMTDGRVGKLALMDFPRLNYATSQQRENYELSPFGIHWPEIDEDLSYEGFFVDTEKIYSLVGQTFKRFPEINANQLALRMGINQSLLAKYICGNRNPSPERLKKIENALHELGDELSKVSLTQSS
ncbi:MAG: DUF2442 domain-containing protein [Rikenellaceae bacterium]|nr:DUF2442 domain-containing protein [Rikenellaceae bacterium]